MINECTTYDSPNDEVVASKTVTKHYTEIRAIETSDHRFGWLEAARLVIFDQGENARSEHPEYPQFPTIYNAIVIATELREAMNFVAAYIGLSVEDQKFENSHIDVHGQNGKYLFLYIAQDAPGWSVAYAMNALAAGDYDLQSVVDDYLMP
ncbi:MAG: hypothetical protein AMJ53_18585 [Gammaproteobacteria bacterium SG8_11]|nr:MAG: hypothetical protein AMJ53_18585 [Gammaproteobacteria bacterium SG8_11]